MKKIILISLFGLMFSQTEAQSRSYVVNASNGSTIDLIDITGYEMDWYKVDIVSVSNASGVPIVAIENSQGGECKVRLDYSIARYTYADSHPLITTSDYTDLNVNLYGNYTATITFLVTAPFPIEDTGYIEEGFDFCLASGQNLVAFPCENPVSVETALPELAQAEISQIIGAGVAATNFNGQFVGSLSNFTPGAGYWFKSSSSMCFNYTCTE